MHNIPSFAVGHQVVIYPLTTIVNALGGIYNAYKGVIDTGHVSQPDEQTTQMPDMINSLLALERMWEVESSTTEKGNSPTH